jgi:hypothetical protein
MAPRASNKLLIALQFWEGDKNSALKVAQFLADLEPRHTDLADLLLVQRFDCHMSYRGLLKNLARKFNVFTYESRRRGVGWPDGCNSLWFGTMEWAHSYISSGRVPAYKAIFTCEADGAPVLPDWLARMSAAWDETQRRPKPVYIAGPLVKGDGIEEHVNGNCLVSGNLNFLHWITRRVTDCPPRAGWDYYLRDAFKQWGWANIPGMVSYYNTLNFTRDEHGEMLNKKLIWVHGDKSNCLIDYGRELYRV